MKRKSQALVVPAKRMKFTEKEIDDFYFDNYATLGIHHDMLKDRVRTESYYRAFRENQDKFKGAVVMDVGAGTGILSLMAAKLGAKKVYAIEASKLASATKQIVQDNGFQDVIEVLNCKAEDAEIEGKVDIIISEWMGYFLYHESMLETVLFARDKWLKEGGLLFPERAVLFLEAFTNKVLKNDFCEYWKDVYGFKLNCLIPSFAKTVRNEIQLLVCNPEDILSNNAKISDLNLYKVTKEEVSSLTAEFAVEGIRTGELHGLVASFDVFFPHTNKEKKQVVLSTSPWEFPTHWQQAAMIFDLTKNSSVLNQNRVLRGTISLKKNAQNFRCYDVEVDWKLKENEEIISQKSEPMNYINIK